MFQRNYYGSSEVLFGKLQRLQLIIRSNYFVWENVLSFLFFLFDVILFVSLYIRTYTNIHILWVYNLDYYSTCLSFAVFKTRNLLTEFNISTIIKHNWVNMSTLQLYPHESTKSNNPNKTLKAYFSQKIITLQDEGCNTFTLYCR